MCVCVCVVLFVFGSLVGGVMTFAGPEEVLENVTYRSLCSS